MEEIIIIFLVLFLLFGVGVDYLPITPDIETDERPEIEQKNITGREEIDITRSGSIYKEFQGHIAGNSRLNVESRNNDVFLRFSDSITGNAIVNVEAEGDIYIRFSEKIEGAARVEVTGHRGNIYLIGEYDRLNSYIESGNLFLKAEKEIHFQDEPLHELLESSLSPPQVNLISSVRSNPLPDI